MQVTVAPLQFGDIPAIIIVGTSPTFYIIHITRNLLDALEHATYPAQAMIVGRYRPAVPNPQSYLTDGMHHQQNSYLSMLQGLQSTLCKSLLSYKSKTTYLIVFKVVNFFSSSTIQPHFWPLVQLHV